MLRPDSHQSQHRSHFRGLLTLVLKLVLVSVHARAIPAARGSLPAAQAFSSMINIIQIQPSVSTPRSVQASASPSLRSHGSYGTFHPRASPAPTQPNSPQESKSLCHKPVYKPFRLAGVCWCRLSTPSSPAHASSLTKHYTQDKSHSAQLVLPCMQWIKPNHISDWCHCLA